MKKNILILFLIILIPVFFLFPKKGKNQKIVSEISPVSSPLVASFEIGNDNSSLVKITKNDSEINFENEIPNVVLTKNSNNAVYSNPEKTMEIRYQPVEKGLKEEIILFSPPKTNKFKIKMFLDNLIVGKTLDGSLAFFDKKNNQYQFHFDKFFAVDNKGVETTDITYDFHRGQSENEYLFTLTVDEPWLNSPDRAYPVIIDPTILDDVTSAKPEVIEKRNQSTKTFALDSDKFSAQSGYSHYRDNQNTWQEIDSTIIPSTDPAFDFMNITNAFKTYLNKDKIMIKIKDASVSFSTAKNTVPPSLDQETNTIKFPKIFQNNTKTIDANYQVLNFKLNEEFILNQKQDFPAISQTIQLTNSYAKIENQTIAIYHKTTNEHLLNFFPPVMFEQTNSSITSHGLHYELSCNLPKISIQNCPDLTITKIIDQEGKDWLNSIDRVYPVVIDPSIGPNDPGTMENDASVGAYAWNNPDNAKTSNDVYSNPDTQQIGSVYDNAVKIVKGGIIGETNKSAGGIWPSSDTYTSYGDPTDKWGETWEYTDINSSNFGVVLQVYFDTGGTYSNYLKATNLGFNIASGVTIDGITAEIEKKSRTQIKPSPGLFADVDHIRITVDYSESTPTPTPLSPATKFEGVKMEGIKID